MRGSVSAWETLKTTPERISNDTLYFIYQNAETSTEGKLYLGQKLISGIGDGSFSSDVLSLAQSFGLPLEKEIPYMNYNEEDYELFNNSQNILKVNSEVSFPDLKNSDRYIDEWLKIPNLTLVDKVILVSNYLQENMQFVEGKISDEGLKGKDGKASNKNKTEENKEEDDEYNW